MPGKNLTWVIEFFQDALGFESWMRRPNVLVNTFLALDIKDECCRRGTTRIQAQTVLLLDMVSFG